MERTLEVGDHVIFIDPRRKRHNALVTAVWGEVSHYMDSETEKKAVQIPCINLAYVSDDSRKEDTYGRQLERAEHTSVVHRSNNSAGANCFIFPDEE